MVVTKNEPNGCRSLVCDANGIIIAEMVYRCMICSSISETISEAQKHYRISHIDNDDLFEKADADLLNGKLETSASGNTINNSSAIVSGNQAANAGGGADSKAAIKLNGELMTTAVEEEADMDDFDDISYFEHNNDAFDSFKDFDLLEASTSLPIKTKNSQGGTGNALAERGGFVTCAVCDVTKFYASVQRRYGQFTCMGCAKFFGRFLIKPRRYSCPNLGSCPLNSGPRCKACLLFACINTYQIDAKRMAIIDSYRPIRKAISKELLSVQAHSPSSSSTTGNEHLHHSLMSMNGSSVNDSELEYETIISSSNNSSNVNNDLVSMTVNVTPKINLLSRPKPITQKAVTVKNVLGRVSLKNSVKKNWGCRKCAGCLVEDCGKCNYCRDKPKFGGPNTLKKKCILRKCIALEEQKEREASERLARTKVQ